MLIKDLQKLGFTKNLATVYLALFELGEAKAGELVRRSGLHRNLVYTALDKLEEKKLVTETQARGVAHYKVLDPARLTGELENKQKLAEQIIEELRLQYKVTSQDVIVYEGKEEMVKKYLEVAEAMKEGENWRLLGISPRWYDLMGDKVADFVDHLKNNQAHILGLGAYYTDKDEQFIKDLEGLGQYKIISAFTQKDSETGILDDRILINILVEPYTVIEIFNKDLVEGYKKYFDYLWKQEVRTYTGWEEVEKLFWEDLVIDLKQGDREYVIGAGYGESENNLRFDELFLKHNGWLIKNKVEKHALFYEKHRDRFELEIKKLGDPFFKLVKVRYLPDEFYSPVETHITNSKCAITYFGDNPVATLYTNSGIISGFKKRFQLMWNMAKE